MSPRQLKKSRLLWLACIIGSVACGDDDGTGPDDVNVSGTWTATVSDLTGGGSSCSSTVPTTLSFLQPEGGVAGLFSGGEVSCTGPNGAFSFGVGSGDIINVDVNGSSISFDLESADFHHSGTISGSSMSGTATWNFYFSPESGPVVLTGTWEADRQ